MIKLVRSNLARLFANGIFGIAAACTAFMGIFCAIWRYHLLVVIGASDSMYHLDENFFTFVNVISVAVAAYCSFYVGIDYKDGTLRNKVAAGHPRSGIYLSNLAVNMAAGCILITAYLLMSFCVGRFCIGSFHDFTKGIIVVYIVCVYFAVISFSAIATCIATVISKQIIAIGMSVGVALASLCYGLHQLNVLTGELFWTNEHKIQQDRVLFLADFLPGTQLMEFFALDDRIGNLTPWVMIMGSVFFIVVSTAIGLLLFRKKELQ